MISGPREIIANLERLHHLMDQAHCAAVVVRSGKNVTYHYAAPLVRRDSWLSRIEIYEGFQQGTRSVSSQFGS